MKKFYLLSLFLALAISGLAQQKNLQVVFHCETDIVPGQDMDLTFSLLLSNNDYEYGDSLALDFAEGVTPLNSPNDPFAPTTKGQAPEALRGAFGQVISWGDNQNTTEFGGIESGKYYSFKVKVHVDDSVTVDKKLKIHVSGDMLNHSGFSRDYNGTITLHVGAPQPDLTVDFADPVPLYYYIPRNQLADTVPLTATVENHGAEIIEQAILIFDASSGGYFDGVQLPRPMAKDTSVVVQAKLDFIPRPGKTYNFKVYTQTSVDSDLSNNTDSALFAVTDSVFSKTSDAWTDTLSLQNTGMIGTVFNYTKADTISSLSVFLVNPQPGDSLRMEVYSMAVGPDTLMGVSRTLIVDSVTAQTGWFTMPLLDTLVMPATSYFVGVQQYMTDRLNMGISPQKFVAGGNFVRSEGFTTFDPAEPLGTLFANSYLIRVNNGTPWDLDTTSGGSTVGINAVQIKEEALLFPNPASTFVKFPSELNGTTYVITDITSKRVQSGKLEGAQLMVSNLAAGTYILQAGTARFKFVRD